MKTEKDLKDLRDFYEKCMKFDWFFELTDDTDYYLHHHAEHYNKLKELIEEAKKDPVKEAMFDIFSSQKPSFYYKKDLTWDYVVKELKKKGFDIEEGDETTE
jgi:hypothetical protein